MSSLKRQLLAEMLAKTSDSSDNTSEEGKRGGECTITEKEELLQHEEETNDQGRRLL